MVRFNTTRILRGSRLLITCGEISRFFFEDCKRKNIAMELRNE